MRSDMEFWRDVRRQVLTGELSRRGACRKYGLGWHTLKNILSREDSHRVTGRPLRCRYKDADDEYLHSSSFTRDEIPVARHLLAKAWNFILDAEAK